MFARHGFKSAANAALRGRLGSIAGQAAMSTGSAGGRASTGATFLPIGFPAVGFLLDLGRVAATAPVFARGTFSRLRLSLNVGDRIKPEQVFDHLLEERQTYGFRVSNFACSFSLLTQHS